MAMGERIKLIRKAKKISQSELADKLGISQQSISQFEKSDNLRYETLKKIADALEISITAFLDIDLKNAVYSEDDELESKVIDKKIEEILQNNDLESEEKERLIRNIINQAEILEHYHLSNIEGAIEYAKTHKMPMDDSIKQETKNFRLQLFSLASSEEERREKLNELFEKLNSEGQEKAIEQLTILSKIPEFGKNEKQILKNYLDFIKDKSPSYWDELRNVLLKASQNNENQ